MSEGPHREDESAEAHHEDESAEVRPEGETAGFGRVRDRLGTAVRFWRAVIARAQTAEVTFLAAAVAYYAFLSLLPVLLLVLSIGSALGGEALADAIVAAAGNLLTQSGRTLVHEALENAAGRAGATVASVVLLIWSMLKVFRGLDIAFLKVYGSEETASLREQLQDGLVAVLGVGVGIGVMFGVGALVSIFDLGPVVDVLGILVLPTVLTVVFLPLYYVFPDVKLSVREVLPGAVLAAVGWTVLQAGFQIYAANAGQYRAYGVLGGVLLLVIWFYLAGIVLLVGAVVNVVWSDRSTPPIELVENRRSVGMRDSENGEVDAAASSDRQLQQSLGSQEHTTPMVPDEEDDTDREHDDQSLRSDGGRPEDDEERSRDRGEGEEQSRVGSEDENEGQVGSEDEDERQARDEDEEIPTWKGGKRRDSLEEPDASEQSGDSGGRNGRTDRNRTSRAVRDGGGDGDGVEPVGAPDIAELEAEIDRLQSRLEEFERDVQSRTVERPKLESELKRYVRRRMRRGHARGWGPYLVLLYGTVLTLGGFYWLDGIYAIGAMIVLALSTLGLYVLFVLFGIGLNVAGVPFRAIDAYRRRRE